MWGHLCTELDNLYNFNVAFSTHKSEVLLHLSQWQYWWWFWFSFFWTFYFFVILRVVKHRVFKMGLRLNTSLRSRGKWGDYLVTLIPLSWCLNILLNSNFILRMIEWQAEAGCLTIRIHGKQWYWVYKYDLQNVYSTLSTPKNIGNRRWFVSHPEGSVLFDTYNQLTLAKLQNISKKEYLDETLVRDFNPTSSFTIYKETPVQEDQQSWPVNAPHSTQSPNRFSEAFPLSYPEETTNEAGVSILLTEVFNKAPDKKTAGSKVADQIIPKLPRARFGRHKKVTVKVSPANKARFRALIKFPKLPRLNPALKLRFKVLSAFTIKKHLLDRRLVARFKTLATPLKKRFAVSPTFKARFKALSVLPPKRWVKPSLLTRFKALTSFTHKKTFIKNSLRERFAALYRQGVAHSAAAFMPQTPRLRAKLQERFQALTTLKKQVYSRLPKTQFNTFLRRVLKRPAVIKQELLARFRILANPTKIYTVRQRLSFRFKALALAVKNNWPLALNARLQNLGSSVFVKLTGKSSAEVGRSWQNLTVSEHFTQASYLKADSLIKDMTQLKFKYIRLARPATGAELPTASPEGKSVLEIYPVFADLENEAFANTFFGNMFAFNAKTRTGSNPTPTSFYENATLDDDWEVYSNTRLQDSETPVRILQHVPQKDNGMFSIRFLDSNESLVEKPDENIEFLVIKQKRYKRKQGFKLVNPHPLANEWVDDNSAAPTSRFLKNNLIFTQIADIGANSSYSYYSAIRLNRTRSEAFSVNLARRLLRTSRTLVLPAYTNLSIIANSYDVVHSWFIPGLGIKMDCVPGKSTHHSLYIDNVGLYYGQCAEICGRYHHHMPIRICALPFDHFILWWTAKGLPKVLKMRYDLKKLDETLLTKYVW